MSAADGPYTLASLRSQYINSLRSRKCSQPFAAAVEKWIVADHRRACPRLGQGCKHAIDTAFGARIQSMELQSEGMAAACRSLVGRNDPPAALFADMRTFALFPRPPRLLRGNGREVLMVIPGSPSTLLWL